MICLMNGAGVRTSSFVSDNTVLLYGSEASLAYSQILHSLTEAPTPSPWAPLWPVDFSAARRTLEILETTPVPEELSFATVSGAIKVLASKTGLTFVDLSEPDQANAFISSRVLATPRRTAAELVELIASRLGDARKWRIQLDGSVEVGRVGEEEITVIYDAPTLIDVKDPMDAWRAVVSLVPGCSIDSDMVPIGSRLAIRTSLLNHFRLERVVRAKLGATGTRKMPPATQPGH
jgi:hypothetical protein